MSAYDYKAGKARVDEILNGSLEVIKQDSIPSDSQFTFENGYLGWVSAIFVDIRDSTSLFQNKDKKVVSKIIRCFTSEIIEILRNDNNLREIGIRGDCVYAIYTTPLKDDEYEIADKSFFVNTYIKELNSLLRKMAYPEIGIGIGVSTAVELVVKAGRKNTGYNNQVWIGEAVTKAAKLSSLGGKNDLQPIVFSDLSYYYFIDKLVSINSSARSWFTFHTSEEYGDYYSAYVVKEAYDNWINSGMPT